MYKENDNLDMEEIEKYMEMSEEELEKILEEDERRIKEEMNK